MQSGRSGNATGLPFSVEVRTRRLGDVVPIPLEWLWPQRVPMAKVTLLVGDPGCGKSLLALDMAARVTRGLPWPDAAGLAPPGNVILLSAEDDVADTIRPRLEAAGGDADRVTMLHAVKRDFTGLDRGFETELRFSLSRDMEMLQRAIDLTHQVRLVVLDPVSAYLHGVDTHSNSDVREVLTPLRGVAERTGAAVVAISHLTKRAEAGVMYRAMGSLAFVAAARAVWAVGPDRGSTGSPRVATGSPQVPGRMLLLPVKCNLAGGMKGMAYRIVPSELSDEVPVLAWESGPVEATAEEAFKVGGPRLRPREQAAAWLETVLSAGPRLVSEVVMEARALGITPRTLRRARREAGVVPFRARLDAPWWVRLPAESEMAFGIPMQGAPGDANTPDSAIESTRVPLSGETDVAL